jgi:hypothetical protein
MFVFTLSMVAFSLKHSLACESLSWFAGCHDLSENRSFLVAGCVKTLIVAHRSPGCGCKLQPTTPRLNRSIATVERNELPRWRVLIQPFLGSLVVSAAGRVHTKHRLPHAGMRALAPLLPQRLAQSCMLHRRVRLNSTQSII